MYRFRAVELRCSMFYSHYLAFAALIVDPTAHLTFLIGRLAAHYSGQHRCSWRTHEHDMEDPSWNTILHLRIHLRYWDRARTLFVVFDMNRAI